MKTVNDVRSEFLGFFEKNGHTVVPSSSLVPHNDPTLMFVNAGMVQFKDVFTGKEKRPYTRATTSQKCVRAGGKHNDLENVGYTARHHTFFEMLGNFSFGDYFKEDAIAFAWEMVTKNFALDPDKLCVTVHSTDEEAAAIWKKVTGFADHKIIRIATDDNFWRMGDTGPCGPCTEIFYDHGEHIWGGPPGSPEEDGDRFIEIWNNVFMQYEQIDAETRIDLPAQSVDTGMGLERIVATLMGSNNNYDIDIMRDLIEHSADLTSVEADGDMAASHKVIADHIRACSFLLADGVMPSNEGRGYVLRRIMRRGMRHAHLLGAKDPIMHKLFPTLLGKMGEAYPELKRAESLIKQTLESEEKRFKVTLDCGEKMLDEEAANVASGEKFSGAVAFKLHDTFGFPLDLTQDALRAKKIEVDTDEFDSCMAEQKTKARAAWSGAGGEANEKIWFDILDEVGATEFLGYDKEQAEAKILAIVKDGKRVDTLQAGEEGIVIINQTPFYAESGGQVGDTGVFSNELPDGQIVANTKTFAFDVEDTKKKLGQLYLHIGKVPRHKIDASVKIDDTVTMTIDTTRRDAIQSNHSVTHLLHEALRQVLGDHVAQKGSLQDADRTRFDVSQPSPITAGQLAEVEEIVNAEIRGNTEVITRVLPIDEARESGAMALFGEKYDDEVRVVTMGTEKGGRAFSIELCGGTHVKRTGDIGKFKIKSEGALASGIRRIEAVTGTRVDAYLAEKEQVHKDRIDKLKAEIVKKENELEVLGEKNLVEWENDDDDNLVYHLKYLQKQISAQRRAQGAQTSDDEIKEINGHKFIGKILDGFPPKDLKPMADDLKMQIGSGVVVLISTDEGKASIVVGVTDDLTSKISAVDLVRVGSAALGGKGGGGRPDMAQAGGPDAGAANDAVTAIEKSLAG
ncbi:MAG: alanine--tRNA ligase [Alphaproteobacteria bacterium]|nr:MAG: alanine--tRNA ligase [Alphaproteobacteria bacterium]